MLYSLEAVGVSITNTLEVIADEETYNRLLKSSMQFVTAVEIRIIKQMVVKEVFFHREFGISAGFCRFS